MLAVKNHLHLLFLQFVLWNLCAVFESELHTFLDKLIETHLKFLGDLKNCIEVLLLIEAMIDAGVQIGFSRDDAQRMVLQTIDGCVELVRETKLHPADLRNRVTSPAGTTAAGLYELEAGNVRATLARAIDAAYRRSQELGALYDEREEKWA